jgi:hypothetical protein
LQQTVGCEVSTQANTLQQHQTPDEVHQAQTAALYPVDDGGFVGVVGSGDSAFEHVEDLPHCCLLLLLLQITGVVAVELCWVVVAATGV